jgi:fibronectin-binding autotransporter adhesin
MLLWCGTLSLGAASYTWTPTATGTYDWNAAVSNWTSGFPNAAAAVANLNIDIAGNQTIRLRQNITLGVLNLGDSAGATPNTTLISNATGETFSLIFDNDDETARLNTSGVGSITNTISASVSLVSDLAVRLGGSDVLTFSNGTVATNTRSMTFSGGAQFVSGVNFNGAVTGSGVLTNNGSFAVTFGGGGIKAFTGKLVANKGIGGSNTGSFTITTSSLANASEFEINGYLIGNSQQGGSIHSGNNSAVDTRPGQRLTSGTITLNGGSLRAAGQAATLGSQWQVDQERVVDTVSVLKFNSGYSLVGMGVGSNSGGTTLNATTLQRGAGATGFVVSSTLGGATRLMAGNGATFLRGAGGAEGSTTMSLIPWLGAHNTNGSSQSPEGFATYTANGIRALTSAEYSTDILAGSGANVHTNILTTIPSATTINALRFTGGQSNITNHVTTGVGQTLTVASGGVFFTTNGGTIGQTGSVRAGTLNFGTAEGVVWANSTNINTIGSVITGSNGMTKAGSGTLILSGTNSYTGTTTISGGALQVGIGGIGQSGTGDMVLNARGTTLAGTGIVKGNTFLTYGAIKPGDSAGAGVGTLTIEGNLSLTAAAHETDPVVTVAEFTILNATTSDRLLVTGDLTLNANDRIVVTLDAGYTPILGDTWTLLDWTGSLSLDGFLVGTHPRDGSGDSLTNLDLPALSDGIAWDVSDLMDSGSLTISVVAVPEPSPTLLLLLSAAWLILRRRRR